MATDCPICGGVLEAIDVAPCYDCGHDPSELDECRRGEHTYHAFGIWSDEIVLCDFCAADFASYLPEYWGLPPGPLPGYPLERRHAIEEAAIGADLYCPKCRHRLAFLSFRARARVHHAA
jgi:hypothetical protein